MDVHSRNKISVNGVQCHFLDIWNFVSPLDNEANENEQENNDVLWKPQKRTCGVEFMNSDKENCFSIKRKRFYFLPYYLFYYSLLFFFLGGGH